MTLLMMLCVVAMAQQTNVIREIVIRGNQRVTRDAILSVMRTKVGQPYVQANLDADKEAIEALGFFSNVDVRAAALDAGDWNVTVDVAEYPEIKEIRVTGNSAITTEEILEAITLKTGDVFNLNAQRPSANAVRELYARRGFVGSLAEIQPLAESPNTLNVEILEWTVGSVTIQGNTRTKDSVLRKVVRTRPGEVYNAFKWQNDLRRLYNTQWFEPETFNVIEDERRELGKVHLGVNVTEARTGVFNVGLQVDPRSSVAGVLSLRETNFKGTGQTIGANFIQATRGGGPSIDLDYGNPFFDDRGTSIRGSLYSRIVYRFGGNFGSSGSLDDDADDYRERRTGATLGFARPVNDDLSLGLSARYESVKTSNIELDDEDETEFIKQDGSIGVLTFGGTLNRRDYDIDPSRGDWLRVEIEPGYADMREATNFGDYSISGSNAFLRTTLEYRKYFTNEPPRPRNDPGASRRVLAFRARYGNITGKVPFFEQYFAGGSETLRGYRQDEFWGTQTFLSTLELRYPIQKAFNAIAFVDYGGAWGGYGTINDFEQSKGADFHLGYGIGFSFRSPLGPIRLDVGFNENGKSRTHFLIGTAF